MQHRLDSFSALNSFSAECTENQKYFHHDKNCIEPREGGIAQWLHLDLFSMLLRFIDGAA